MLRFCENGIFAVVMLATAAQRQHCGRGSAKHGWLGDVGRTEVERKKKKAQCKSLKKEHWEKLIRRVCTDFFLVLSKSKSCNIIT